MLKLEAPANNAFSNFKCGEVFCISPAVFNVNCCLCAVKIHLDQFPSHFQMLHLDLVEESINLEELERKTSAKLTEDEQILNITIIKEEDPIKHEDVSVNDNEILQLLGTTEKTKHKLETFEQNSSMEEQINDSNICEKLKVGSLKKEKNAKRPRRSKNKGSELKEIKDSDEMSIELDRNDFKEGKEEINGSDLEDCDDNMDRDWFQDDNSSETESEAGNEDIIKAELPYPCYICKRAFRTKHGLLKHNQIVHNPKKPFREPKEEHKCDECNEMFRNGRELQLHKWKHTGVICDICGKSFTQAGNMMRHKLRHTGIKDHKCDECGKAFFTSKEMKAHKVTHSGHMAVICEICGKQCRHRAILTAHMRRHTGERPAKCDVCGKCFFSIHDLNIHAVAHTSERPFKCDICGSTFQRRKALRVHKLIHSKDRKHVCAICGKGFTQSGSLKSHMKSHNRALEKSLNVPVQQAVFPNTIDIHPSTSTTTNESEAGNEDIVKDELHHHCHTCKRSFRSKHGLLTHKQMEHNPDREPKSDQKCDECNEVFRTTRELQRHKWKHTGIVCDICGKSFTQAGGLMRHKQRHSGIKEHKCDECGKEFFTASEVKAHKVTHSGHMPVICEICGKQCRNGVLNAHMRRHTGERPAKCDVCGKCFYSIHDLNVHAVAHTSERPFKCDICGLTFQRRKALRVHKLIHSKERKYVCKICGKGFTQSGSLRTHMKSHDRASKKSAKAPAQQSVVTSIYHNSVSLVVEKQNELNPPIYTATKEIGLPPENILLGEYLV